MKLIRKILVRILGLKGYLRFVSRVYIIGVSMGWMRKKYPELFFLKKVIQPGNTVLDIGANLGYYSFFMSYTAGKNGKVYAVEPVPLFAEIWKKNLNKLKVKNYQLSNCALGIEPKPAVKMSIPVVNGVVRHGLTKVEEEGDAQTPTAMSFEVEMKNGDALIQELGVTQLDFIKCDVEGFEQYVIPSLRNTISNNLPVLQIELSGEENRKKVCDYLVNLSYEIYILKNEVLVSLEINDIFTVNQDFYFIHRSKKDQFNHLFK